MFHVGRSGRERYAAEIAENSSKFLEQYMPSLIRHRSSGFALAVVFVGIVSQIITSPYAPGLAISIWFPIAVAALFVAQFQTYATTKEKLDILETIQRSDEQLQETLIKLADYVNNLKDYLNESIKDDDHLKEVVEKYERRRTKITEVISGLSRAEAKLFSYGGTDPDCPYIRKERENDDSFSIALPYAQSRIVWDIEHLEALIRRHTEKGTKEGDPS